MGQQSHSGLFLGGRPKAVSAAWLGSEARKVHAQRLLKRVCFYPRLGGKTEGQRGLRSNVPGWAVAWRAGRTRRPRGEPIQCAVDRAEPGWGCCCSPLGPTRGAEERPPGRLPTARPMLRDRHPYDFRANSEGSRRPGEAEVMEERHPHPLRLPKCHQNPCALATGTMCPGSEE